MKNNMSRRQFLKTGGLALAAMTFQPASVYLHPGLSARDMFRCVLLQAKGTSFRRQ